MTHHRVPEPNWCTLIQVPKRKKLGLVGTVEVDADAINHQIEVGH